jgi:hypothetical protein
MTAVRILIDVHERQSRIADVLVEELGAEVESPCPSLRVYYTSRRCSIRSNGKESAGFSETRPRG